MINVSYQYLPDTKAYLDPSRTSTMGILLQNVFLQNCRSLSSKFTDRKESHPGVFWWILRDTKIQLFCRKPSGNCFCSTQKSFTNKIEKNPLRKEKIETACKKNNDLYTRRRKNLFTIYISLHIFFFFSASMIYWKH